MGRYRRLLVPLDTSSESFEAFQIACQLAVDDGASITAITVIEIPPLLPLDSHTAELEEGARRLLERAESTGDSYGVKVTTRIARARDVAAAILTEAKSDIEVIVIGTPRRELAESPKRLAPSPLVDILRHAPCRVMVVSAPSREAA